MIRVSEITEENLIDFMTEIENYYNDCDVIDLKILKQDIYYQALIIYKV